MDKVYIAQRLKKYLFLISIIFVVLTTSHLIYSYIYSDAKETAIKWWSISEALIGQTPSLNPLKNSSANDQYINSIVYRSLLKYDVKSKTIKPDLAKCDTRNLLKIECFLQTNIKWSNWDEISADDIIATFKTLKDSKVNPIMNSLLKNTTIEKTKTSIIFTNTKKDINILKIFFQPIVSQKILNIISQKEIEWNFSISSWIYSWKYKVTNILKEETSNITTVTLEKNTSYYKNNVYIDTIIFRVFPDFSNFLKNKNSINIFNDKNNLIAWSVPKLGEHKYSLPQYVSLFTNTRNITNNDFRKLILSEINKDEIIKELWEKNFKKIKNPYLSDIYVKETNSNKTFKNILNKKWYYSLEDLEIKLKQSLEKEKNSNSSWSLIKQINNISWESKIKEGSPIIPDSFNNKEKIELNSAEEKIINSKSNIIFSPSWVDKYNFVSRNDYLLKWKTKPNTTEVYINDYKLKSFTPHSNEFAYRISEKSWNFNTWDNNYKIYFVIDWKKELQEEINFYRDSNKEKLKKAEKDFFENKKEITNNIKTSTWEKLENKNNIIKKIDKNIIYTKSEKYKKIEEKIKKLKTLDKKYFYNEKLEKYNLELYYVSNKIDIWKTAKYISDKLSEKWIKVSLREISTKDLNWLILEWKKNYDLLLTWVNLSYFDFNIYPYYHSSQIEKWYNFSNFRKLDLDIVLEELKSKILPDDKKLLLEKKVLNIIKENNLSKTLYTPLLSNLVDKNIKWYSLSKEIPEDFYRFEPIYKSYVNEDKKAITDNKGFLWYIKFLINTLF